MFTTIGKPMEILLIEDDLVHARLAMEAVDRGHFQHRMTPVFDGREALEFLQRRGIFRRAPHPDLILLDLRLPKVDGLEVLAQIKADPALKSIPVVVMTSSQDEEDRTMCEKYGVEAYMTKPVDLNKFLVVVKALKRFWRKDMVLPQV